MREAHTSHWPFCGHITRNGEHLNVSYAVAMPRVRLAASSRGQNRDIPAGVVVCVQPMRSL